MKSCHYSCGSQEHLLARRNFLGGLAGGAGAAMLGGLGSLVHPATAAELVRDQKRMLVVRMAGGLSQLESWDPKPGTSTGGPFRAIPTSVPGIHLSELLPHTAKQMHHLALLRGINTHESDHGKGNHKMLTGRKRMEGVSWPEIGAVVAKGLDEGELTLPGHVKISPGGTGGRSSDSAYLGPKYASMSIGGDKPLANSARPSDLKENAAARRDEFRCMLNDRFALRRRTAETDAYTQSFEQAEELVKRREVFDLSKESEKDRERYGAHDFGRHCLLARRLLENGISFVQVTHSNYDTHNENFNFHFEQLGEFDKPFATLVADIAARGMLDSTLIVVLTEFGRTPNINKYYGRDHWGKAWSICIGGAKVARGAVFGKTNEKGTEVTEGEVDAGHLFHTYLSALGIRSTKSFEIGGRKVPMADPAFGPIGEILT